LVSPNREIKGRGGDRRSKDYHLTLDTAKETAMVERNEKGRQIRRTGSYIKNSLPQEERIKMVADQVANATASAVMQAMKIEN
ncbi:antA/AntB antirepressor family protein, partial [Escherichia coli]|uniref:antA/AntB antirepressor family protein n=1 Tax=Escherichia coli TaxID=562 RepID=UPI003EDFC524